MNWSNLAGFLMIAVPAIMIVTHIGAGLIGTAQYYLGMAQARKIVCDAMDVKEHEDDKREDAAILEATPYATYEEWQRDVRYGHLDVAIRRSLKGIPPKNGLLGIQTPLATARVKLAARDTSQERTRMDAGDTKAYSDVLFLAAMAITVTRTCSMIGGA